MQTAEVLKGFEQYLIREERGKATVQKYMRDAGEFLRWLGTKAIAKEQAVAWKEHLTGQNINPMTVNGKLAAVNRLFLFLDKPECRVKYLKLQRKLFRSTERELNRLETWPGTAGVIAGKHLRHGHSGVGGEISHCGSGAGGLCGDLIEGQDPHDPHSR